MPASLSRSPASALAATARSHTTPKPGPSRRRTAPATATPSEPPLLAYLTAALDDLKAEHILIIPLAGKSSLADHLIIATGTSSRHLASLAERLHHTLLLHGAPFLGKEGDSTSEWLCVDAGDTIIHLFTPQARTLYNLEKLWSFPG